MCLTLSPTHRMVRTIQEDSDAGEYQQKAVTADKNTLVLNSQSDVRRFNDWGKGAALRDLTEGQGT